MTTSRQDHLKDQPECKDPCFVNELKEEVKLGPLFESILADAQLSAKLNLDPMRALKRQYEIPERGVTDRGKFFTHGLWNETVVAAGVWNGCTRISNNIILGKIVFEDELDNVIQAAPKLALKNNKMETQQQLGAIFSYNDYFELGGSDGFRKLSRKDFLSKRKIVTPSQWENKGIEHFCIPMKDYEADVPAELLLQAYDKMREYREKGMLIYVHCKSGKGRSLMGCVIEFALSYLEEKFKKDGKFPADEDDEALILSIEKNIQESREQVSLDKKKVQKAVETIRAAKAIWKATLKTNSTIDTQEAKEINVRDNSSKEHVENNYLSSLQAKSDIAGMIFFKELAIYAAREKEVFVGTTRRSKHIQDLFNVICEAKNDDWFHNFDKHCEALLKAAPNFKSKDDEVLRRKLVAGFKEELSTYLQVMQSANLLTGDALQKVTRMKAKTAAKTVARQRLSTDCDAENKSVKANIGLSSS